MKTLLLLRHAKSGWKDANQLDFERPLNERGHGAAPLIGSYMRKQNLQPDLVLCSPALRAKQTAFLVAQAASFTADLRYDQRIYEAPAARLVEVISQVEDAANKVLLVGHNPGLEDLLENLTNEEHQHIPTAALALLTLNVEKWNKVRAGCGKLEWLVKPKELNVR